MREKMGTEFPSQTGPIAKQGSKEIAKSQHGSTMVAIAKTKARWNLSADTPLMRSDTRMSERSYQMTWKEVQITQRAKISEFPSDCHQRFHLMELVKKSSLLPFSLYKSAKIYHRLHPSDRVKFVFSNSNESASTRRSRSGWDSSCVSPADLAAGIKKLATKLLLSDS